MGLVACEFDGSGVAFNDGGATADIDGATPETDGMAAVDAAVIDATSVAGNALLFDGTDDLVGATRQIAGDFTIEVWLRTTDTITGSQHYHGLSIVHADRGGNHNDFGTAILNGHFAFGTGNPDVTIESSTEVTTGDWVHLAATREQSTGIIRLYVNGDEEAALSTGNSNDLTATDTLTLGANPVDGRFFRGMMDEVRIWNTARSGAEILANKNTRLVGTESGLVNYWRFDEGSGMTTADATGSNDGSLGNGSAAASPNWFASGAPVF